MSSRTFFFLRDSITKKFYTGQNNVLEGFESAAVYFQLKNAEKKIKDVISSWEHQDKYADYWVKEKKNASEEEKEWARKEKEDAKLRKGLDKWGIEIVSKKVSI